MVRVPSFQICSTQISSFCPAWRARLSCICCWSRCCSCSCCTRTLANRGYEGSWVKTPTTRAFRRRTQNGYILDFDPVKNHLTEPRIPFAQHCQTMFNKNQLQHVVCIYILYKCATKAAAFTKHPEPSEPLRRPKELWRRRLGCSLQQLPSAVTSSSCPRSKHV